MREFTKDERRIIYNALNAYAEYGIKFLTSREAQRATRQELDDAGAAYSQGKILAMEFDDYEPVRVSEIRSKLTSNSDH